MRLTKIPNEFEDFFKSKWSGTVLGPIYGLLIYLYLTYLILNGPPFTPTPKSNRKPNQNLIGIDLAVSSDKQTCGFQEINNNEKVSIMENNSMFDKQRNKLNSSINFQDHNLKFEKCKPLITAKTR